MLFGLVYLIGSVIAPPPPLPPPVFNVFYNGDIEMTEISSYPMNFYPEDYPMPTQPSPVLSMDDTVATNYAELSVVQNVNTEITAVSGVSSSVSSSVSSVDEALVTAANVATDTEEAASTLSTVGSYLSMGMAGIKNVNALFSMASNIMMMAEMASIIKKEEQIEQMEEQELEYLQQIEQLDKEILNVAVANNELLLQIENQLTIMTVETAWRDEYNQAIAYIVSINEKYDCMMGVNKAVLGEDTDIDISSCCEGYTDVTDCQYYLAKNFISTDEDNGIVFPHIMLYTVSTGSSYYGGIGDLKSNLLYTYAQLTWDLGYDNDDGVYSYRNYTEWVSNYLSLGLYVRNILTKSARCRIWAASVVYGSDSDETAHQYLETSADILSYTTYVMYYIPDIIRKIYVPASMTYNIQCINVTDTNTLSCENNVADSVSDLDDFILYENGNINKPYHYVSGYIPKDENHGKYGYLCSDCSPGSEGVTTGIASFKMNEAKNLISDSTCTSSMTKDNYYYLNMEGMRMDNSNADLRYFNDCCVMSASRESYKVPHFCGEDLHCDECEMLLFKIKTPVYSTFVSCGQFYLFGVYAERNMFSNKVSIAKSIC